MAAFTIKRGAVRRGFPGYELDWEGDKVLAHAVEAARRGINDISKLGSETAKTEHPWETRTGQTEAAIFWKEAVVETNPLRVWGEWGVEDRPRFHDPDEVDPDESGQLEKVSTKDVAMFLEFGTVKMEARPFLYPAWDKTKVLLPAAIKAHYEELEALHWRPGMGEGKFRPFSSILGEE